jgi:hypothetical protein
LTEEQGERRGEGKASKGGSRCYGGDQGGSYDESKRERERSVEAEEEKII